METSNPFYFTVVKYVPSKLKYEPRNIGVIVQCPNRGYISCKFYSNLRNKLSSTASQADLTILKRYINKFTQQFELSSTTQTRLQAVDKDSFINPDFLNQLHSSDYGKIEFTEPGGGITDNPEKNLLNLFKTYIGEEKQYVVQAPVATFRETLTREFNRKHWLAGHTATGIKHPIEEEFRVPGGKTKKELKFDFGIENSQKNIFQIIDLRLTGLKRKTMILEAALKFDDASHGENQKRVEAFSVVNVPKDETIGEPLEVLKAYSEVFIYPEPRDKNRMFSIINKLVTT